MRDPDLMQRADRAAIALEQAWDRWRAVHGLGAEPLPPVSSYVGYSLEEPWGQPRVVFGLRADEAELLAAQLDGHECAGPSYLEVGTRRRTTGNGGSLPARPYADPLSVPAQAPPPAADLLSPPDYGGLNGTTEEVPFVEAVTRGLVAGDVSDADDEPANDDEAWPGSARDPALDYAADDAGDEDASAPLAPIPDLEDVRPREDEAAAGDPAQPASGAGPSAGLGAMPAQGPGYRGPRYQGFPPRYDPGPAARRAADQRARVAADDGDAADVEAAPAPARRSHAAKSSRTPRRRTQNG